MINKLALIFIFLAKSATSAPTTELFENYRKELPAYPKPARGIEVRAEGFSIILPSGKSYSIGKLKYASKFIKLTSIADLKIIEKYCFDKDAHIRFLALYTLVRHYNNNKITDAELTKNLYANNKIITKLLSRIKLANK